MEDLDKIFQIDDNREFLSSDLELEILSQADTILAQRREELESLVKEQSQTTEKWCQRLHQAVGDTLDAKAKLQEMEPKAKTNAQMAGEVANSLTSILEPISAQSGEYTRLQTEKAYLKLVQEVESKSTVVRTALQEQQLDKALELQEKYLELGLQLEKNGGSGCQKLLEMYSSRKEFLGQQFRVQLAPKALKVMTVITKKGGWLKARHDAALNQELQEFLDSLLKAQFCETLKFPEKLWALDTLLEPLSMKFRYHFESFSSQKENCLQPEDQSTSRHDKPEWAFTWLLRFARDVLPMFEGPIQEIVAARGLDDYPCTTYLMRHCTLLARHRARLTLQAVWGDESLFAHLIEETLAFEETLEKEFGYGAFYGQSKMQCPRVITVFAADPTRHARWLETDGLVINQRCTQLLEDEKAWTLLQGTRTTQSAKSIAVLFQSVTKRYRLLQKATQQIQFVNQLQKPLVMRFYTGLYEAAKSCQIYKTVKQLNEDNYDKLRKYCCCVNATWYVYIMLRDTSDDLFFIDLQKRLVQEGLLGQQKSNPYVTVAVADFIGNLADKTEEVATDLIENVSQIKDVVKDQVIQEVILNESSMIGPTKAISAVVGGVKGAVKRIRGGKEQPNLTEQVQSKAEDLNTEESQGVEEQKEASTAERVASITETEKQLTPAQQQTETMESQPLNKTEELHSNLTETVKDAINKAQTSLEGLKSVFEVESEMLHTLLTALLEDLTIAVEQGFTFCIRPYLNFVNEAFQTDCTPSAPTQILFAPLSWLEKNLEITCKILGDSCFRELWPNIANHLNKNLFDQLKLRYYSEKGGHQLQLDMNVIFGVFQKYTPHPENFFKDTKELCLLMSMPTAKLESLIHALQDLATSHVANPSGSPEYEHMEGMLEACGIYKLSPEVVQHLIPLRIDVVI